MSVSGDARQETKDLATRAQAPGALPAGHQVSNDEEEQLEGWMEPQNAAGSLAGKTNSSPLCLASATVCHSKGPGLGSATAKEDTMDPGAAAASSATASPNVSVVAKVPVPVAKPAASNAASEDPLMPLKPHPGMLYASPVKRTVVRVKLRGVNPNELNPVVAMPGLLEGLRTNFPTHMLVGCGVRAGCVELTLEFIEAPNQQGTLTLAPGQAQQIAQLLARAAQAPEQGSDGQQNALLQLTGGSGADQQESEGESPSLAEAMLTLSPGEWLQWLGLAQERAGPVAVDMGMDPSAPLDAAVAALSDSGGAVTSGSTRAAGAQVTVTVKVDDMEQSGTPSFASLNRHSAGRFGSSSASLRTTPFQQSASSLQGVSGSGSERGAPANPAMGAQRHRLLQQQQQQQQQGDDSSGSDPHVPADGEAAQLGGDLMSAPASGAHDIASVMDALSEGPDSPHAGPGLWVAGESEHGRFPCCQAPSHPGSLSDASTLMPLRRDSLALHGEQRASATQAGHGHDSDEDKAVRISALAPIAIVAFHDGPPPPADVEALLHLAPAEEGLPARGPFLAHLIIKLCASRRAATTALRHAVEGVRFTARCQGHDVPLNLQPLMPTGAAPPAAWLQQQQRLAQLLASKHAAAAATTAAMSKAGRNSRNQAMMRGLRERRAAAYASMAAEAATALASNTLESDGVLGGDQMLLVDDDLAVTCWAISLDVRGLRLPAVLYLEVWAGHELLDSQPVVLLDSTTAPIASEIAELAQSGTRRTALSATMPPRRTHGGLAPPEPPGAPPILPYRPADSEQQQQGEQHNEGMRSPLHGPASSVNRPVVHTWSDGSSVQLGAMSEGGAVHNSRHASGSVPSDMGHRLRTRQRMLLTPQRSEPLPPHMSGSTAGGAEASAAAGGLDHEWSTVGHGTATSSGTHYDSAAEEEYGGPPAGVSTRANSRAFLQDLGTWMGYCSECMRRAAAQQQKQSLTPATSTPPLADGSEGDAATSSGAARPRLVHSLLQQQGAADGVASGQEAPNAGAAVAEGVVAGESGDTSGVGGSPRPASSMKELDELLDELREEVRAAPASPLQKGTGPVVSPHHQGQQQQGPAGEASTGQRSEEAAAALMGAFLSRLAANALAEDPAGHARMVDLGTCLLHYAVLCGWPALASRLLSELISPSVGGCTFQGITHHRGVSLFHQAVRSGRPSMIRIVVLWGHRFSHTWSAADHEALVSPQPLLPPVQPPAQPAAAVAPAHEAPVSITAPPADVPAWQQSIPALGMSSGEGSTSVREVLLAARAANGRRRQQFLQDSSTQDTVAGRQQEQLPGSPPSHSSDAQSYASGGTPFAHISISSRGPHGKPDEEGSWMGAGLGFELPGLNGQQLAKRRPDGSGTVSTDGMAASSPALQGPAQHNGTQAASPALYTADGDAAGQPSQRTLSPRHLLLGFPDHHLERQYQLASAARQAALILPWSLIVLLMAAAYVANVGWTLDSMETLLPTLLLVAPYIPLAYIASSPALHAWLAAGVLACALGRVAFQVLFGFGLCSAPHAVVVLVQSHLDVVLDPLLLCTLEQLRTLHALPLRCLCLGSCWAVYSRLGMAAAPVLSIAVNLCGLLMTSALDWAARLRFLQSNGGGLHTRLAGELAQQDTSSQTDRS